MLALPCLGGTAAAKTPTGACRPTVTRVVNCGSTWAIASRAVLDGAPATVVYDVGDAEFTVLERDRAPRQSDSPICLDCLLELQPGLGRGLDVAKEHGIAYRIDGEWMSE